MAARPSIFAPPLRTHRLGKEPQRRRLHAPPGLRAPLPFRLKLGCQQVRTDRNNALAEAANVPIEMRRGCVLRPDPYAYASQQPRGPLHPRCHASRLRLSRMFDQHGKYVCMSSSLRLHLLGSCLNTATEEMLLLNINLLWLLIGPITGCFVALHGTDTCSFATILPRGISVKATKSSCCGIYFWNITQEIISVSRSPPKVAFRQRKEHATSRAGRPKAHASLSRPCLPEKC